MHATRVGLTGGIACGKSAVAELWRARGATIIDTDVLAHAALAPGTAGHRRVLAEFGAHLARADGTIDRAALGEIVFQNEAQRQQLNAIVHPVVRAEWRQAVHAAGTGVVRVVMIPLLFEVGAESEFERIVAVGCSAATQIARLTVKGLSPAQAQARREAQWPVQTKMDRADFVIWNDGSRVVLARQAELVWQKLKEE